MGVCGRREQGAGQEEGPGGDEHGNGARGRGPESSVRAGGSPDGGPTRFVIGKGGQGANVLIISSQSCKRRSKMPSRPVLTVSNCARVTVR